VKREVGFSWTTQGQELPRYFIIRLGDGPERVIVHLSEEEALDLFDQMESYRKDWQRQKDEEEYGKPIGKNGIGLTKTEARDVFEVVSNQTLLDLEKHHLEPHVRKNLDEAQFKLQTYVWPGLCGPWGCHGEHGSNECNLAICEKCKESFDICKCPGGPDLRVRNR